MKKTWFPQWDGFKKGIWTKKIDTRDFIQLNYTPYEGGAEFLAGPTQATSKLWDEISKLMVEEREKGGVLGFDNRVSGITAYKAGYINKDLEQIVGIQTEKPFVRAFMPQGGIKMAVQSAEQYGYHIDPEIITAFTKYGVTHNQAVFDSYTPEMMKARHVHILTGLPDTYGRGRIIGDYRRIALYGIDYLINERIYQQAKVKGDMSDEKIRTRYEISQQIKALKQLKEMGLSYGIDMSLPAKDAKEAIQFTYFGYLAAIRDQNGAAMSIGRNTTFFDIYIKRDMEKGILNEQQAQELIDHYVMKLRIVKFMRTTAYNNLFGGDPVWATETLAGMGLDGRTLVTKSSFRVLHTLSNMGPAPEPNLTVLWSDRLPAKFKEFCANYSIKYSSIQYESDELMRPQRGDDYAIACCVSPMAVGKEMQLFGARANLAKALLYAINNGYDELHNEVRLGPDMGQLVHKDVLDFEEIWNRYKLVLDWLAGLYVNVLNVIHYNHDRHYYEALEMALHDIKVTRFFATGIAGMSVVADSLSAIKYAKVKPVYNDKGIAVDFNIEGDFPKYGNDDDKVDTLAIDVMKHFAKSLAKHKSYRKSEQTTSILTITSNVMYGGNTGATPDGRKSGEPFAPGANPMHGRDCCGAVASLNSVAKLPFAYAADGISNTFSIVPSALGGRLSISTSDVYNNNPTIVGNADNTQAANLIQLMDGYFAKGAQHLNVNVLNRETLIDAQKHPEKYPQLTIRVSGYAVNFVKLSKKHQDEVIARTFHDRF